MKNKKPLILSLSINFILVIVLLFIVITKTSVGNVFSKQDQSSYKTEIYTETVSKHELSPIHNADIVFLGDSIVGRGLWDEYYQEFDVVNRGIGTDTTIGIVNRIEQVTELEPKKVFIMAGLNDLTNGYTLEEILSNYETIITNIKSDLPDVNVYVHSVLPIQENKRNVKNDLIKEFNGKLEFLVNEKDVTYIDIHDDFVDDSNNLKNEFTEDGTHLTGLAYSLWIDSIEHYVNE